MKHKPGHRVFQEGERNIYLTAFKTHFIWNFDFIVNIPADPSATSFCSKQDLVETYSLFQTLKDN